MLRQLFAGGRHRGRRVDRRPGGTGSAGGSAALERLDRVFAEEIGGVSQQIAPDDEMFADNRDHYFQVGQSALRCVKLSLLAAGRNPGEVKQILDLPSGHGRVLRTLRAAFPEASITACDILEEAVGFCARSFGARPVVSCEDLGQLSIPGTFDLIWCGSLLTHLDAPRWEDLLGLFESLLAPRGVLVFTVHGRSILPRVQRGWDYGLGVDQLSRLAADFRRDGFAYVDYPGRKGYGISVSERSWTVSRLERHPSLRLLLYAERGWDDHQDAVACIKDVWEAPPGPAEAHHAGIDFGI